MALGIRGSMALRVGGGAVVLENGGGGASALRSGGGAVVLGNEGMVLVIGMELGSDVSVEPGRRNGGACSTSNCAVIVALRCSAAVDRSSLSSKHAGLGLAWTSGTVDSPTYCANLACCDAASQSWRPAR